MLGVLLGLSSLINVPPAEPSPYFLDASTVAQIECGNYLGSAFYIGDGKFVTAKHMVRNTDKKGWPAMRCTIDNKTVRVIEIGKAGIDYAIVSGPIYRPYRAITSCAGFVEGQPYFATGYAEGNPWVVTQRFIASSAHMIQPGLGNYNTILRGSDVEGQSGGPVSDTDGLVVGIVSQGENSGKTESYILALADTDICKNNRSLN
jgi:S1-C subfamily serine protease